MSSNLIANPFGDGADIGTQSTAGALQNQSREASEIQVKYLMAQKFPRDERVCMDKILNAFTRPSLAEKAQYQYARGGTDIVGPSIRSAETIALAWSNFSFGFREVSRGIGADGIPYSEVEAFARDLQQRTERPAGFIVRHWRDTKSGGYKLKDERDIYELISNQAQRRVRSCILALVPGDVIEAAMKQAEVTLRTTADTSPEAMSKMLEKFKEFSVTKEMIEKRIQRRLDAIQPAQVVSLRRIYASLQDDMSEPADWFEGVPRKADKPATVTLDDLKRGETIDKETGEITEPAKAAAGPQETSAEKPEAIPAPAAKKTPSGPQYESLVIRMRAAKTIDDLGLVMDAGRDLPPDQKAKLSGLYDEREAYIKGQP